MNKRLFSFYMYMLTDELRGKQTSW